MKKGIRSIKFLIPAACMDDKGNVTVNIGNKEADKLFPKMKAIPPEGEKILPLSVVSKLNKSKLTKKDILKRSKSDFSFYRIYLRSILNYMEIYKKIYKVKLPLKSVFSMIEVSVRSMLRYMMRTEKRYDKELELDNICEMWRKDLIVNLNKEEKSDESR